MSAGRVRHLLAFEWRRVKWVVIASWLMVLVAGVPDIMAGFGVATFEGGEAGGTGQFGLLATGLALVIMTVLTGRKWREVRPLRAGEVVVVRGIVLAGALVVPVLVMTLANLMFLGFSTTVVAKGMVGVAGVVVPLWLGWALFAAYAEKVTVLIAGLAVLGFAEFAINFIGPGTIVWPWIDAFGMSAESSRWVSMGSVVLLLVVFFPVVRGRGTGMRMSVAVGAVVAGWVAGNVYDANNHRWLFANAPAGESEVEVHGELSLSGGGPGSLRLGGLVWGPALPSDGVLVWKSARNGMVRQDEVVVAREMPRGRFPRWVWRNNLGDRHSLEQNEMSRAVCRELKPGGTIYTFQSTRGRVIGERDQDGWAKELRVFMEQEGAVLRPEQDSRFEGSLLCSSLRYRLLADLGSGQTGTFRDGSAVLRVRMNGAWDGRPGDTLHNISLSLPSVSEDGWDGPGKWPLKQWQFVFHYPESDVYIPARLSRNGRTRTVGGARRWRTGLELELRGTARSQIAKPEVPRLLVFRPEVRRIGRFEARGGTVIGVDQWGRGASYSSLFKSNLDEGKHAPWRVLRPDPRTATTEEVGSWLRIAPYQYLSEFVEHDVAEFAGRHPDLILAASERAQRQIGFHQAYVRGAPESERDELIAKIGKLSWASGAVVRRGWAPAAVAQVEEALRVENPSRELLRLGVYLGSERATDVILDQIANGRSARLYGLARQIPGIDTQLDEAVESALQVAPENARKEMISPRGEYIWLNQWDAPIMHGRPDGVAGLIAAVREAADRGLLFHEHEVVRRRFVGLPGRRDLVALAELDADDFRWDVVRRMWVYEQQDETK
jgi:hypothetical protein